MTDAVRVFVSYAHADRVVQTAFESQLKAAETQGAFEYLGRHAPRRGRRLERGDQGRDCQG